MNTSHTSLVDRWRIGAQRRQRAIVQYLRRVRPLVALLAETMADVTEAPTLEVEPHIFRLLALWRWLDQVMVPPGGARAHAALTEALEQTLIACGAILTRQPREAVAQAHEAALASFDAFQVEMVSLIGVEQHVLSGP